MKSILLSVIAGTALAALSGCATPDFVRLQGDKIDRVQQKLDDLSYRLDKLQDVAKTASEAAKNATQKADTAMQLLKK
jgi:outer membrane murein-binding lipoprotein Lpp